MREELVSTKLGKVDAYLIEARSLGGLSGSPVFAQSPMVRVSPQGKLLFNRNPYGSYMLVGLVHGHYDALRSCEDIAAEEISAVSERINVGIAVVVPVEMIVETIRQPAINAIEEPMAEDVRRQSARAF